MIDSDWDYCYNGAQHHPILRHVDPLKVAKQVPLKMSTHIVKILVLSSSDMDTLVLELQSLDVVVHRHLDEHIVDISPKGVHKWSALQKIGIMDKTFVCFGNDTNDISMFQHSLHAVMIGNYEKLAPFANEKILVAENNEETIIEK